MIRWMALALVIGACGRDVRLGERDAGSESPDSGSPDSGSFDAGTIDDGGAEDVGLDAGAGDAGPSDAGPVCVDEDDDGYGEGCVAGPDCDDTSGAVFPGATETCDGVDDDCDERIDEGVAAMACALREGVCAGVVAACVGGDFTACDYGADHEAEESRCDELDNDCDGTVDEGCACVDGSSRACGESVGACEVGTQRCAGGAWAACEGAVGPGDESCDGTDEDCDDEVDEALTAPACALTAGVCGGSRRSCGGAAGWRACEEADYGSSYEVVEATCDGLDNDCDGDVDEALDAPACDLVEGVCAGSVRVCDGPAGWGACAGYGDDFEVDEARCDGLDNDCDGEVDEGGCATGARLAKGIAHSCAIDDVGRLKCWGHGYAGALGLGDEEGRGDEPGEMGASLPFVDLGTGRSAVSVVIGHWFTCAILDDGSVKCWGSNRHGQLGIGDDDDRGDESGEMGDALPAVDLGGRAVALAMGLEHACAVLEGGVLKCWGRNLDGRLGLGDTYTRGGVGRVPSDMGMLPAVELGAPVRSVALGRAHSCALLLTGEVKCWGENDHGQLGLGDTERRGDAPGEMGAALPAVDLGPGRVVFLASALDHTCALMDDGGVRCWGEHRDEDLSGREDRGDAPGEMGSALIPDHVDATITQIALGQESTFVLTESGEVYSWGRNLAGSLGLGDRSRRVAPAVSGMSPERVDLGPGRVVEIRGGHGRSTCARFEDGRIKCWGSAELGNLGLGDEHEDRGDEPGEMGAALPAVTPW